MMKWRKPIKWWHRRKVDTVDELKMVMLGTVTYVYYTSSTNAEIMQEKYCLHPMHNWGLGKYKMEKNLITACHLVK
jgi:hypothetical protein